MSNKITIDFETRSDASLKDAGAWAYSMHPSTEVICLGWEHDGEWGQWLYSMAPPLRLFKLMLTDGVHAEAHNSKFEQYIWENVCFARMGWPFASWEWRCSAAKAAACSIPRSLANAGMALRLSVVKDLENKKAMQKLTRPRKPSKANKEKWVSDPEVWEDMASYNMTDVASERALSDALPDLSARERKVFLATERMNRLGFAIDRKGVEAAIRIATDHTALLSTEFQALTGIDSPTKREKLHRWLAGQGTPFHDTQAKTLDDWLAENRQATPVRRAIEILRSIGRSSTAKYEKMVAMMDPCDDRIRGCFLYCGAVTGRWSGSGVQPHNFPRGGVSDMDQAWECIKWGDYEAISAFADPMEFLSDALRGAIWAPEGRELYCGDYSGIEARVTFWMADDQDGLDIFRRGEDIYLDMAGTIFGRKVEKHEKFPERFLGKQAILGLGFGMGFVKFLMHCRSFGVSFTPAQCTDVVPAGVRNALAKWVWEESWDWIRKSCPWATKDNVLEFVLMKFVVDKYRKRFDKVIKMWYALEDAAKAAVNNPGKIYAANKTRWQYDGKVFLKCQLPSGRIMRYPFPEVRSEGLTYMTAVGDAGIWGRKSTYGGKLAENVIQATARDAMAEALLRMEGTPYEDVTMLIHDELVSEVDLGNGRLEEFSELIAAPTDWSSGLPINVESWAGKRYRK